MQKSSPSTVEKDFSDNLLFLTETHNPRILAAFSGGCDSLALVALLSATVDRKNIVAAYVNHRLRPDAELEREIQLNRENCAELGVELEVADLGEDAVRSLARQRGNGLEEAARILRYKVLEELAGKHGCSFIATAHHLDDQLETVYMRMLRKSPVTSLRGISERKNNIIRPLLNLRKNDLESYLESRGLQWSEDSTNTDNSIERNRIRNVELPRFAAENPDYVPQILKIRENAVSECSGVDFEAKNNVSIRYLKALSPAKRMVVLFTMWDLVMETLLPQTLTDRVNEVLDSYPGGKTLQVSANGAVFSFSEDSLYLTSITDDALFANCCEKLEEETQALELPLNLKLVTTQDGDSKTLRIRYCDFKGEPVVRFAHEGDRITMAGGTKRVSRVLQDMKIPPALRKRVPLIADDEGVCAVFGRIYGGSDRLASRFRTGSGERQTGIPYTCLIE